MLLVGLFTTFEAAERDRATLTENVAVAPTIAAAPPASAGDLSFDAVPNDRSDVAAAPTQERSPLAALADLDQVYVLETVNGRWVPQLSAKRVGAIIDGRLVRERDVLAEHRHLRSEHAEARLIWTGDWRSFEQGDFWVTVVARPFGDAAGANQWCDDHEIDRDHCFAKRVSDHHDPSGSTVSR